MRKIKVIRQRQHSTRNRARASATQQEASEPASKLESPNAAEEALIRNAQEELSQNYEKAKADRAAALRKANKTASAAAEQARVAAEEAQTLRKNMAAQAQIDRYSNCPAAGPSCRYIGLCLARKVYSASPNASAH